jgi:hypothetical protein
MFLWPAYLFAKIWWSAVDRAWQQKPDQSCWDLAEILSCREGELFTPALLPTLICIRHIIKCKIKEFSIPVHKNTWCYDMQPVLKYCNIKVTEMYRPLNRQPADCYLRNVAVSGVNTMFGLVTYYLRMVYRHGSFRLTVRWLLCDSDL